MSGKRVMVCLAALLVLVSVSACAKSQYEDGVYTAQVAEFPETGWKDTMEITIENGKLVKVNWDAIYKDDSIPIRKKQYSKSGLYGMLAGGAVGEWYDQATAAEQFVLKNGIDAVEVSQDGYTDAITGCTVHVSEFTKLIRECLEQAKKQ